jgi:transposase
VEASSWQVRLRQARPPGQPALEPPSWKTCSPSYRALTGAGLTANLFPRTAAAKDARRLARRFRTFEDLILRFATRPDLDIFTNNQAERTIRPVKIQQ